MPHGIFSKQSENRAVEYKSYPARPVAEPKSISLADKVEKALSNCQKELKVAVMGCVVNGPGEAREADIGIAGGDGEALLFKKGVPVGKYPESEILDVLLREIEQM